MKKVFVSVPFKGREDKEIRKELMDLQHKYLEEHMLFQEEVKFVNNYIIETMDVLRASLNKNKSIYYLGVALQKMSDCDDVIFSENWEQANGCQVEHLVYELYIKKRE